MLTEHRFQLGNDSIRTGSVQLLDFEITTILHVVHGYKEVLSSHVVIHLTSRYKLPDTSQISFSRDSECYMLPNNTNTNTNVFIANHMRPILEQNNLSIRIHIICGIYTDIIC